MPRLVRVARTVFFAGRVAQYEPVLVRVLKRPRTSRGGGPIGKIPGGWPIDRAKINYGAKLVLGVASTRACEQRFFLANRVNPVLKRINLVIVAAIRRLN